MKYKVDPWNNFCRVLELPDKYPEGYCFGGPKPTEFKMHDWFYPVQEVGQAGCSKEVWAEKVGPIEEQVKEIDGDELIELLTTHLQVKNYVQPNVTYLVICDFGLACTFVGEAKHEATTDSTRPRPVQPVRSQEAGR